VTGLGGPSLRPPSLIRKGSERNRENTLRQLHGVHDRHRPTHDDDKPSQSAAWPTYVGVRVFTQVKVDCPRLMPVGTGAREVAALCSVVALVLAACGSGSIVGPRAPPWPCCDSLASCSALVQASREWPDGDDCIGRRECEFHAALKIGELAPASFPVIDELLGSSSAYRRGLGATAAQFASKACRGRAARALLQAWVSHHDDDVIDAIAFIDDPQTVGALVEALSRSKTDARSTSRFIHALDMIGPPAAAALPRLAEIAAAHWDSSTRLDAAFAYQSISGETKRIAVAPDRCPTSVRRSADGAQWEVLLAGGARVALSDVHAPAGRVATQGRDCQDCRGLGLRVDDECLLSTDSFFEMEGRLEPLTNRKLPEAGVDSPRRLSAEPRLLYLQAIDSIMGTWDVEILTRANSASWSRRLLASAFGSQLVAFALAPEGAVDVLVRDDSVPPPGEDPKCAGRTRLEGIDTGGRPAAFFVLQVRPDATVTARD
jgi:hypothetical protein